MNKAGRTVVHLRASNVVDALAQPFAVRYRLPSLAWAREPALWGASLAAILATLVTPAASQASSTRIKGHEIRATFLQSRGDVSAFHVGIPHKPTFCIQQLRSVIAAAASVAVGCQVTCSFAQPQCDLSQFPSICGHPSCLQVFFAKADFSLVRPKSAARAPRSAASG